MAAGNLDLRLRPLRLALLINGLDKHAIAEAIRLNTFLWGGSFNPIVPLFRRLPTIWNDRPRTDLTARTVVSGYLDAFDPDYVVAVDNVPLPKAGVGYRQVIPSSEILAKIEEDGTPKYGIGLVELLNHFAKEELKFVRHHPLRLRLPEWGTEYALFFAATFGALPEQIEKMLRRDAAHLPGLEWHPCSIDSFAEFLEVDNLFLRRFGVLHTKPDYLNNFWRRDAIFFMDAARTIDVVDFWNLRASGWNVMPVPKQAAHSESLQKLASDFVAEHCYRLRDNPSVINHPTLLKSRSTTEAETKAFWTALHHREAGKHDIFEIAFQFWMPSICDQHTWSHNNVAPIESQRSQQSFDEAQAFTGFKPLAPAFAAQWGGHDTPRFANEIDLRIYGGDEPFAEAIPEAEQDLEGAFSPFTDKELRFSKRGPVHLTKDGEWPVRLSLPRAENLFQRWLLKRGWKAELSDKGHVAKQMLRQLGGVWGTQTLAEERTLALFAQLENGVSMGAKAFRAELNRIYASRPAGAVENFARRLIEVGAIRIGLELRCPHCRQRSWFSISEADYALNCPKCLQSFSLPSHSPNEIAWSYRSIGPFSLPDRAYGAFAVLLTLRFFARVLDAPTTPMLSFNARNGTTQLEADLGLFSRESREGMGRVELVFAECKTSREFMRRDAERMAMLGERFPGAILVFATLNRSLTRNEQAILRPVANRGRRRSGAHGAYNPVLILTGIELFGQWRPNQTWKDLGGVHARFASYRRWPRGEIVALCEATQQIYLGLPPLEHRAGPRSKKLIPQPAQTPPTLNQGGQQNAGGEITLGPQI